MADHYDFLNLPRTATTDEIKSRVRRLLIKLGQGQGDETVQGAVRHLLRIQTVLLDKRDEYDAYLRERDLEKTKQVPPPPPAVPPLAEMLAKGVDYLRSEQSEWLRNLFSSGGGRNGG